MAEQAVEPFIMRNAVVQLGTDDFAAAVSSVILAPTSGTVPFKGLKPPAVFTFAQATTWELQLEFAQDWKNAASLSNYLHLHQGEVVPGLLIADDSDAGAVSWELPGVAIAPGSVGGPVDAVAVSTATLGVVGAPIPTQLPPAAQDDALAASQAAAEARAAARRSPADATPAPVPASSSTPPASSSTPADAAP